MAILLLCCTASDGLGRVAKCDPGIRTIAGNQPTRTGIRRIPATVIATGRRPTIAGLPTCPLRIDDSSRRLSAANTGPPPIKTPSRTAARDYTFTPQALMIGGSRDVCCDMQGDGSPSGAAWDACEMARGRLKWRRAAESDFCRALFLGLCPRGQLRPDDSEWSCSSFFSSSSGALHEYQGVGGRRP